MVEGTHFRDSDTDKP